MSAQADPAAMALVRLLVDALAADPAAVSRLRELVGSEPTGAATSEPAVSTVASLAAALHVTDRVVRGAIARGELAAVKRGGRYIISAHAVDAWAAAEPDGDGARRERNVTSRSRGPLRAALDAIDVPGANLRARRL